MADMDSVLSQGFACRLWRLNPDSGEEQTIPKPRVAFRTALTTMRFPIFNTEWHVSVSPVQPWYTRASVLLSVVVSLLLSLSVAAGVQNNSTIRRMERKPQKAGFCPCRNRWNTTAQTSC
jgi:hypothetical protein